MANNISFDASEVLGNLDTFKQQQLPQNITDGLEKATMYIEAESKKRCPAGDGILRASITHYVDTGGTTATGYVGSNVEYAPYVHQGTGIYALEGKGRQDVPWSYQDIKGEWHTTKGMKPTPFMQEAIDANLGLLTSFFKGLLGK
jgi:hypothetical protein